MVFWPVLIAAWALAQQPSAQAHFERGRVLFEEHDDTGDALREAAAEFRQALALDPRLAAALAYLGFIAADENRLDEAGAIYRKALVLDPQSPEARVGLARLAVQQNRYPEAIRLLRMAVAAVPDHRLARRELALYLTQENSKPTAAMREEAIECWNTLIRLDANDRDAHHDLARAYEHLGRWADAEEHYREVLRIGQTDEDSDVWVYSVHANVAEMLEKQGKFQDAIREYEVLIDSEGPGDLEIENARKRIEALQKPSPR